MADDLPHGDGNRLGAAQEDEWCSINEAARRLKVTPTAIRNRIKRGTLETRPNGNYGRLVRVPRPVTLTVTLTDPDTVPDTVPLTVSLTDPERVPPTGDPVAIELRTQVTDLQARLVAAQDDLIQMARDAGMAQGEIAALRAEAESMRARMTEAQADRDAWRAQAERLSVPVQRRPWWHRLVS